MGYLICEKCNSYYELQPGESTDDFSDECECGGKLIYSNSLEGSIEDFNEPENTITCPYCGTENPEDKKICKSCKRLLNPIKTPPKTGKASPSSKDGIMDSWNKQSQGVKLGIGLAGVCCIGLIVIVGLFGIFSPEKTTQNSSSTSNTVQGAQITLTNTNVVPDTPFGNNSTASTTTYVFNSNLKSGKDYSYLQMVTKWYDSSGAVLNRDPITWNTNDVKAGETYKISSTQYLTGKPARVDIMVFDSPWNGGSDSGAIYKTTISVNL